MKIKKIDKKLSLHKSTVASLDNKIMDKLQGGVNTVTITLPGPCTVTCDETCVLNSACDGKTNTMLCIKPI